MPGARVDEFRRAAAKRDGALAGVVGSPYQQAAERDVWLTSPASTAIHRF